MSDILDLCDLEPKYNIAILGPKSDEKIELHDNILHIFGKKNCNIGKKIRRNTQLRSYHKYTNNVDNFVIGTYHETWGKRFNPDNYDLVIIYSVWNFKNELSEILNNFIMPTDYLTFAEEGTFFVIGQNTQPKICRGEKTYLKCFEKNTLDYGDILKSVNNIANGFSMYHDTDSQIYKQLLSKLKKMYFIIFSLNNKNDELWLPAELHLEIIKLLFLLCE